MIGARKDLGYALIDYWWGLVVVVLGLGLEVFISRGYRGFSMMYSGCSFDHTNDAEILEEISARPEHKTLISRAAQRESGLGLSSSSVCTCVLAMGGCHVVLVRSLMSALFSVAREVDITYSWINSREIETPGWKWGGNPWPVAEAVHKLCKWRSRKLMCHFFLS